MAERVSSAGVVGLGSVGEPLAALLRAAGVDVIAVDSDPDVRERVRGHPGLMVTSALAALDRVDVIIEAVPERIDLKCAVLRAISAVSRPDAVLVTTAAAPLLTRIAIASGRPTGVVGLTMLAPPGTGRRVAVTRTAMVDARAARVVERLVARLEIAELAVDGRALARAEELVLAFLNRAVALAADGYASVEEIDTAMRLGCRLPIGPLELLDLCGLDSAHELMDLLHRRTGGRAHRPAPLLGGLVRSGAHGRKTRRGFHGYTAAGDRRPLGGGAGRPAPAASGLDTVGVLGSGTMARGIAETAATAGYPTVLVARDRGRAGAAVESIGASLLRAVRRGVITPGVRDRALALLRAGKDTLALAECDLVIEAVVEDIDVKRAVFGELDKVCAPSAVLATTTSSLPVIDCANATSRPADVVGLHFFNPVPAMRLVELVRTEHTRSTVLKTARMFCGSLGKTVVECGDRCGFIVNFLLFPYLNDAIALLEAGAASIPEIDAGIEQGFGFPMGPFALMDTIGLDVCLDILRGLNRAFPAVASPPNPLLGHLVAAGHTGRKTGGGFFNYER